MYKNIPRYQCIVETGILGGKKLCDVYPGGSQDTCNLGKFLIMPMTTLDEPGATADLHSPPFRSTQSQCVEFFYFIKGPNALNVSLVTRDYQSIDNFSMSTWNGSTDPMWTKAGIFINSPGTYRLRFSAIHGPISGNGSVSIDDVFFYDGACDGGGDWKYQGNCDFDRDFRFYTPNPSFTTRLTYKWERRNTPRGLQMGPPSPHSSSAGYFLSANSQYGATGDRINLTSPVFNATNGVCVTFYFYLFGSVAPGPRAIRLYLFENGSPTYVCSRTQTFDGWLQAGVWIISTTTWNIMFEVEKGNNFADIAIDEIKFTDLCSQMPSTIAAMSATTSTITCVMMTTTTARTTATTTIPSTSPSTTTTTTTPSTTTTTTPSTTTTTTPSTTPTTSPSTTTTTKSTTTITMAPNTTTASTIPSSTTTTTTISTTTTTKSSTASPTTPSTTPTPTPSTSTSTTTKSTTTNPTTPSSTTTTTIPSTTVSTTTPRTSTTTPSPSTATTTTTTAIPTSTTTTKPRTTTTTKPLPTTTTTKKLLPTTATKKLPITSNLNVEQTEAPKTDRSALSVGEIAGISVSGVVFLIVVAVFIYNFAPIRRQRKAPHVFDATIEMKPRINRTQSTVPLTGDEPKAQDFSAEFEDVTFN